ncbi:NUDIX hydrolase [Candidatus Nomurabacteria bacterium]|nr:NUDIX hydrolase [Candidatus Nomurabacteria bacterium]
MSNKVPDNAKKVYESKYFRAYTWQQELFDGTFREFEAVEHVGYVLIIAITEDGHYVAQRNMQPGDSGYFNSNIAGRLETFDEDPIERAKIELLEEAGMQAKSIEVFDVIHSRGMFIYDAYIILAKGCKKVADIADDPGEKIENILLPFDEFLDFLVADNAKNKTLAPYVLKLKHNKEYREKFLDVVNTD